jgi:hypothetical protein
MNLKLAVVGRLTVSLIVALLVAISAGSTRAQGLTAQYFNDADSGAHPFSSAPLLTRIDPVINFDWGTGSPDPVVHNDYFSVRWTGVIVPRFTDHYEFHLTSDDRSRLWIDGKIIIDDWDPPHAARDFLGSDDLVAGKSYPIKVEYQETQGGAVARLEWMSALQVREFIPASQLHPTSDIKTRVDSSINSFRTGTAKTYRISAGGVDVDNFTGDNYYTGDSRVIFSPFKTSVSGIAGPAPEIVYEKERFGKDFTYTFPSLIAHGNYNVRLHFAESMMDNPGTRTFNVFINGRRVLTNFDIYATAGKNQGVVREFFANAADAGQIAIRFVGVIDNAKINGIEILPV